MRAEDFQRSLRVLLAAAVVLLGVACSEEGGSIADNGGIGGTGLSQGQIDAFGSIFVNGVEWDLTSAAITVGGRPATEADLRRGMNVRVVGEIDGASSTGVAASVAYDVDLIGPIASMPVVDPMDPTRLQVVVFGRIVDVDERGTVFGPGTTFGGLATDDVVEITGFEDATGGIRATRIETVGTYAPDVSPAELEGPAALVMPDPMDPNAGIFDIGATTIRYTASTDFDGLDRADLMDGLAVDVEGTLSSRTEIDATRIERASSLSDLPDLEDVELEGFVADFVSATSFSLEGVVVDASMATLSPPSLVIANGVLVEIEGRLESGVLLANEIKAEDVEGSGSDEAKVRASITSVDALARTLVVLGITVAANGETQLEDERDGVSNFGFAALAPGDWLDIEGHYDALSDRIVAKNIHRKLAESDVVLTGPVTAIGTMSPPDFGVAGRLVPLDSMTVYRDELDAIRSESEFFGGAMPLVELDDVVRVTDSSASDPALLSEVDEVRLAP